MHYTCLKGTAVTTETEEGEEKAVPGDAWLSKQFIILKSVLTSEDIIYNFIDC